ncbi:MAG: DUF11 domain-containing protein [Dehalococcoidia bacterium]|nr:DUF11 domain-containing protein [Dehalococcoidia bacterium]
MKPLRSFSGQIGLILLFIICASFLTDGAPEARAQQPGPFVSDPVTPGMFDGNVHVLPPVVVDRQTPGIQRTQGILPGTVDRPSPGPTGDGALAPTTLDGAAVTPAEFANANPNFDGIPYTGFVPPDPVGDVGPNHYIEMVNSQFQIFDKQGGNAAGPFNINSLWVNAGVGNLCLNNNNGDPYVVYDHLADRWLMSQFAVPNGFATPPTAQCIAISQTADPVNGGWYLYEFVFNFGHDYPKIGLWPDGYYMSSQQGFSGGSLNAVVFDRANMLNGNPATFQAFTSGSPALIWLPSDLDGPAPPPGTPNIFARHVDGDLWGGADRVDLRAFSVDWGDPTNSSFTPLPSLATAAFDSDLCNGTNLFNNCVPQPTGGVLLETLTHWAMGPLQYRDFGDYATLVFNHTVDVDGADHAGVRWYELRDEGAGWFIRQQATHSPDAGNPGFADDPHRWMGSIAMDKAGNMALGYSISDGNTIFPGVAYVGRLAGDPLGLMPQGAPPNGEFVLVNGQDSQIVNGSRWGDYSAMRVDPVDNCTFWYVNQYITNNPLVGQPTGGAWGTRIGAFRFPSCNQVDLSINKTDSPDPVVAGEILTYTVDVTNNGGNTATNAVVTDTLPSGVTYIADSDSCVEAPALTLTCSIGNLAGGGNTSFTIQVRVDASLLANLDVATTSIGNTASVDSDQEDANPEDNSVTISTNVIESADLRITKECKPDQPNAAPAGTETFCDIYVDNLGPSDARDVVITDQIISTTPITVTGITSSSTEGPAASCSPATPIGPDTEITITCEDDVLPAGARDTITVTFTADEPGDVDDTATVSSETPDPDNSNNIAIGRVTFAAGADLSLDKTASPDPVTAGEELTYTITVTNDGPSTAQAVEVRDDLPAELTNVSVSSPGNTCNAGVPGDPLLPLTCNMGNLASGDVEVITVVADVRADTPDGTILFNQARVSSDTGDPDNSNNNDSVPVDVEAEADLEVVKTSDAATYKPNTTITYRVTVTNLGSSDAQNVLLVDQLLDDKKMVYESDTGGCIFEAPRTLTCDLGVLEAGESTEFFIFIKVKGAFGDVPNTATVSSSTDDPDLSNNEDTLIVAVQGGPP